MPRPAGAAALAVLLAALVLAAAALAATAFPRLTGRVVDEAGVIDPDAEARLSRELEAHERATGNQVVVATVRSLQGLTVEEYANRLHREWKLGRKEHDDGALLLVAPGERRVRIESGYGLEGVLTDAASSTIIQSLILPRFRAGDLQGGVEAGARGILELLRPEEGAAGQQPPAWARPPREQEAATGGPPWWVVMLAFLTFVLVARALNRANDRRRRGRGPYPPRGGPFGHIPRRHRGGWGHGLPPVVVIPGGFGGGGDDGGSFGGGGGGGFSGGGGSSGGGGASGSW